MIRLGLLALACCLLLGRPARAEGVFPGADWETAAPESQGLSAEKLDKAREWLASHNSRSGLVVRHGRIVAEWYFQEADRNSRFAAYSTSKSLSSMATGLAIADGKLTLDTTVGQFQPDVQPAGKKAITVKQLLSMSSGVHNNPEVHQRTDLFTYALNEAPLDHPPGSKWDYNNTGLALLSPVFQKATGKPIDDFLNERVFKPIGIAADDWTWERREGYALPYSGCHMTARGMGRIGLLVLNKGEWDGRRVVPADWLKESIGPSQDLNKSYGYLWWNNTTNKWPKVPQDAYAALGRWDNNILIVPSLDLVVIRQSDLAPAQGHQIAEYFALVCDAVAKP
ncbi:serine hydrolase domain-containing protein [Planctomyces sp. SH-PL14]|uniref:serine hydrolase domain-containing protein n=1 Tax=Planctomyces sp. SH-PL14 TaxID=1632864 RepID=UPI00078C4325|nr:serine hydrolase [Planctomyces sp. SH-PL14]AMV19096.1 Putative penicillin-binding protein PbpX [Planctomyces sp. SH-PL14]